MFELDEEPIAPLPWERSWTLEHSLIADDDAVCEDDPEFACVLSARVAWIDALPAQREAVFA